MVEYPPAPASLDLALMDSTLLVATLLETKTVLYEFEIRTWGKYRILERLSTQSQKLPPERDQDWQHEFADAPKSMLPLAADEFLMDDNGGTAIVDGVRITTMGNGSRELSVGSKYLIFALFGSARRLAGARYGPASYFTIDNSDNGIRGLPSLIPIKTRCCTRSGSGRMESFRVCALSRQALPRTLSAA